MGRDAEVAAAITRAQSWDCSPRYSMEMPADRVRISSLLVRVRLQRKSSQQTRKL